MTTRKKPNGPLTGWLEAGSELIAEQLTGVTKQVNVHIENQQRTLDELQTRGAALDARIRQTLSPAAMFDNVEQLVKTNPLWSLVPALRSKPSKRAAQLDALSAKVDLLVEQVALLAAKEAKARAERQLAESVNASADMKSDNASTSAIVEAEPVAVNTDMNIAEAKDATSMQPTRRPSTRKKTVTSVPKVKARTVSTATVVKPPVKG